MHSEVARTSVPMSIALAKTSSSKLVMDEMCLIDVSAEMKSDIETSSDSKALVTMAEQVLTRDRRTGRTAGSLTSFC